jgi:hypothetical protein
MCEDRVQVGRLVQVERKPDGEEDGRVGGPRQVALETPRSVRESERSGGPEKRRASCRRRCEDRPTRLDGPDRRSELTGREKWQIGMADHPRPLGRPRPLHGRRGGPVETRTLVEEDVDPMRSSPLGDLVVGGQDQGKPSGGGNHTGGVGGELLAESAPNRRAEHVGQPLLGVVERLHGDADDDTAQLFSRHGRIMRTGGYRVAGHPSDSRSGSVAA